MTKPCATFVIAAPGSGHGKTTITAALATQLRSQGLRVQIAKLGPDYLDPMVLQVASEQTVVNLDLWIMGECHVRACLAELRQHNDIVLIESLMGLHDNQPSSAEFAVLFDIPVLLVMNMGKYAQTSAALVQGLADFNCAVNIAGVIGNLVGSDYHHTLIKDAVNKNHRYLGSVRRHDAMQIPSRHLGLQQATEISELAEQLNKAAQHLDHCEINLVDLLQSHRLTASDTATLPSIEKQSWLDAVAEQYGHLLQNTTIAIADDLAFSFIYPNNKRLLKALGANCIAFSPLNDQALPPCDALWLPGGYPELHAASLSANVAMRESIKQHIAQGKPTLAECGGMIYLGQSIALVDGQVHAMAGAFAGDFTMHDGLKGIGHQQLTVANEQIRGHSFHHSSLSNNNDVTADCYCQRQDQSKGEAVYQLQNSWLSYSHFYFPSNPKLVAQWFKPAN